MHRRVPAALVVALTGVAITLALWFGGCDPPPPPPLDAIDHILTRHDAAVDSGLDTGLARPRIRARGQAE